MLIYLYVISVLFITFDQFLYFNTILDLIHIIGNGFIITILIFPVFQKFTLDFWMNIHPISNKALGKQDTGAIQLTCAIQTN